MRALLLSAVLAMLTGCTYVGTSKVDQKTLDDLARTIDRMPMGLTREGAMERLPLGRKQKWGEGHAADDAAVLYEEWRVDADDSYDQASELDGYRILVRWMYFRDDSLYEVSATRMPLWEQAGVIATWRRTSTVNPFGVPVRNEEQE